MFGGLPLALPLHDWADLGAHLLQPAKLAPHPGAQSASFGMNVQMRSPAALTSSVSSSAISPYFGGMFFP